ncbi:MAG TPA: endonuclease/exonuclease/phosphatase family protein, partial [Nitrosospira sp.]|nr:endonuclease/exonuclease/phosphatase family protein [Nitrosospira sp.]
ARSRTSWGAFHPEAEEEVRSTLCQKQFIAAAGGLDAAMMVAPCTAYGSRKHPTLAETIENYDLKLEGLRATVEKLIEAHGIHVIAFQEVKSEEVVRHALGKFSGHFEVCVAPHSTFQTVAFAWDKSVLASEYTCIPHRDLAIAEHVGEKHRRVRPGLALELIVNGLPVTFLNIHLKSGCANLHGSRRWPSRLLTDPEAACTVLNRQVPILEDWIEQVASRSPRFILLGDFNRRIDQEARARIARTEVRADGSDPAEANIKDEAGGVKSDYLWQEIADGSPPMYQVYLKSLEPGCKGLAGLDHIVVSGPIKRAQRERLYSSKIAPVKRSRQPIPTSDHCPTITTVEL